MAYPTEVDAVQTPPTSGALGATTPTHVAHHQQLQAAVASLRTELGTDPGGGTDVTTRLARTGYVNVLDYGASRTDGISAVAQSAAFQAAYDYATPLGRHVYAPAGTYTLTTFAYPGTNIRGLIGDDGKTIIRTSSSQGANNGSQFLFWISGGGETGGHKALTQDALAFETAAGSNNYEPVLHVASGHGIIAGDYVAIGSATAWPNSSASATKGEIGYVHSVTATTINLAGKLHDDYTTAASAYVVKLNTVADITFSGITFQNTTPLTGVNGFLLLQYCRDVTINRCEFVDGDWNCVYFQNGLRLKMTNCHGQNLASNETGGPLGFYQGRLVVVSAAAQDCVIANCTQQKGTHLFSTGGLAGPGVPRNITVANCTAYGGLAGGGSGNPGFAAFDTHEEGDNINFVGCTAVGRMRQGFQARCPNVTFFSCVADGTEEIGFWLGNATTDTKAIGCIARNIKYTAFSSSRAFQVDGTRSVMKACVIDGSETQGIRLVAGSINPDISDVSIYRTGLTDGGYAIDFNAGAQSGVRMRNILIADCTNGINAASATFTDCVMRNIDFRGVTNPTAGAPPLDGLQTPVFAASFTPDPLKGNKVKPGQLTANITINAPAAPYPGQEMVLELTQDAASARTATFNAIFKGVTAISATLSSRNIWRFLYDGTNWIQMSAVVGIT